MKKRVIIYTIVIVLFLISIILLGTYAYFSANINSNNATYINTTTASGSYNLLVTNTGTLTHSFNIEKMMESSVGSTPVANGNSNIEVKLLSPDNSSRTICIYDLVWEWKSTDQYTTSDAVLPLNDNGTIYNYEMSVKATSTTTGSPSGVSYGNDNTLNETDLSSYTWNGTIGQAGYKTTIHSNAVIISDSSTTPTVTKWNVSSYIYNLPVSQTKIFNKTFKADIKVDNLKCDVITKSAPAIISGNLDTNGSEVAIGSEYFYVLGEDETNSSNVKLLSKYNLFVGSVNPTGGGSIVPVSKNTLTYNMQSSSARGWASGSYIGVISFSTTNYWDSNLSKYGASSYSDYPYVYDENSILYNYVEKYKTNLKNYFDIDVTSARLINYSELNSIRYTGWGRLTSYWSGSAGTSNGLVVIHSDGDYRTNYYYYFGSGLGIRPVIIVPKSIFN